MGGKDANLRLIAFQAWSQAGGDYKTALKLFKQHPSSSKCKRPDRFIMRWGRGFTERRSFIDKQRPGRPRRLSKATVDRAAGLFMAGFTQDGSQQHFSSLNEALDISAELRSIVSSHYIAPRTLLRHMQKSHRNLVQQSEDLKPILSTRLKQLRIAACEKLLKNSDEWFYRLFWLDAKTMHIVPSTRKVWVDRTVPMRVKSDARLPRSGKDRRTLHFYAMVNWCVGPVAIVFVTGTSGLQQAKSYTVSHWSSK